MQEMEHLDMTTPDGAQLNLDALYRICPSCFTETASEDGGVKRAVDWNKLRALLGDNAVEDAPEAYDFTWVGKRTAQREAAAPITKTLRPCPEESVDWENTQNLYIEGDNLEVLKLLQNSYMGKVKMIYIDPPYNTGNDFVYHDDFAQSADEYDEHNINEDGERFRKNTDSNGRFHSDWCSMMYSRLIVARNCLSTDGVIFISIDDNEIKNLKNICDEVFGEKNYIALLSVENNPKGRKNSRFISVSNEYCLIYAKNIDTSCFMENIPKDSSDMTLDENGNYVHGSGKRVLVGYNEYNDTVSKLDSDKHYSVYYNPTNNDLILIKDKSINEPDNNLISSGYNRYFSYNADGEFVENTYSSNKFLDLFYNDELEFKADKIYEKNMSTTIRMKSMLVNKSYRAIINNKEVDFEMDFKTTSAGTKLKNLFGTSDTVFSAPKNCSMLRLLMTLFKNEEMLVFDFFSGSASIAEAVFEQNFIDHGKRKFILVQYPEIIDESNVSSAPAKKTIKAAKKYLFQKGLPYLVTEIAKERIKLAGHRFVGEKMDTGFRVFKCDESNMKDVYFAPKDYTQDLLSGLEDNIKDDRTDLDLLFDCMLRWGVELSLPLASTKVGACTIHNVNDGDLVACFDGKITEDIIDAIAAMKPLRVVFRDSSFTEAAQKMNLFELFKQKCGWSEVEVKNNVRVI